LYARRDVPRREQRVQADLQVLVGDGVPGHVAVVPVEGDHRGGVHLVIEPAVYWFHQHVHGKHVQRVPTVVSAVLTIPIDAEDVQGLSHQGAAEHQLAVMFYCLKEFGIHESQSSCTPCST
jgi:hypothetical protein